MTPGSSAPTPASPPLDRHPVLLLHGIWKTGAVFRSMSRYLTERGFAVHSLDLVPSDGRLGLDKLAEQVGAYIERAFSPSAPLDLVGFSMGGVVARYYIQRLGGIERVRRFVTISSPHHGSRWAYAQKLPGYLQLRPNSPFIEDLNSDVSMLSRINFTSIWTPLDLMILPPSSSRLPVGEEVVIATPLHALMLLDPRSLKAVAGALSAPLRR
jgi:triacylglycerol lipase